MLNIPIDEYTSILEPYYDGSESYKGHQKYSVVHNYIVIPKGFMRQEWDGVRIDIIPGTPTVLKREGFDVDISCYDRFRLFGIIPECVHVRMYCNGELVLDDDGSGKTAYLDGKITTSYTRINSLIYEFTTSGDSPVTVSLHYMGMISDKARPESPFTAEWEGFFSDTPYYGIYRDYLINEKELQALRDKIKHEPYKSSYERARETALKAMEIVPEERILRTVNKHHREPFNLEGTIELALVGQIEENHEMLRMACRYALSLASCEYWSADVMETVPTVTWCHRAFNESFVTQFVSTVIWLAGGILTWHGRNYLYNMIIMKGFPRIEADLMMVDYIYHCNQGIAFLHGYIQGLITVVHQYPRYQKRLEEAHKILDEIYDNVFGTDGGFDEGAAYWDYTLWHYLPAAYYLARYDGKTFKESSGQRLVRTSDFGISILNENGSPIPFGDCSDKLRYSMMIPALMYSVTDDMRWASLFFKTRSRRFITDMIIASTVDVPPCNEPISGGFSYFPKIGIVKLLRQGIMFAGMAGPSNDTHCHCDKGSFVIYKNGEPAVPDLYAAYNMANSVNMYKTGNHSLAIPVFDGKITEQHRGRGFESVVEKSQYQNGVFEFVCDNSGMWDSTEIICSKRIICSDKANEFIVTDEFRFLSEAEVEFRLNIKDKAQIEVTPVNWEPYSTETVTLCNNNGDITLQRRLRSHKFKECRLVTRITVL